ncbi:hypothetical protein BDR04DRAFT_668620 [Suillus decipiens]|nr:hypothetical protein BDR04DRAFT_668620 [Suillus decipiens]
MGSMFGVTEIYCPGYGLQSTRAFSGTIALVRLPLHIIQLYLTALSHNSIIRSGQSVAKCISRKYYTGSRGGIPRPVCKRCRSCVGYWVRSAKMQECKCTCGKVKLIFKAQDLNFEFQPDRPSISALRFIFIAYISFNLYQQLIDAFHLRASCVTSPKSKVE